jgi:hypothetical protein
MPVARPIRSTDANRRNVKPGRLFPQPPSFHTGHLRKFLTSNSCPEDLQRTTGSMRFATYRVGLMGAYRNADNSTKGSSYAANIPSRAAMPKRAGGMGFDLQPSTAGTTRGKNSENLSLEKDDPSNASLDGPSQLGRCNAESAATTPRRA